MHGNKIQMNERQILDKVIEESSPNLAHVLTSAVFGFGFFHAPFNWKYLSRNQLHRIPPIRHFLPLSRSQEDLLYKEIQNVSKRSSHESVMPSVMGRCGFITTKTHGCMHPGPAPYT